MPYSFEKVEPEEQEEVLGDITVIIDGSGLQSAVPVWNILDEEGDSLAIVLSEGEAEALVSHLNR